ncbi:MAG: hypothetical protein SF052_13535 [Bacteroidia bacterium]|nr:hypothetical protein [Bacteroidia bacterium]
MPQILLLFFVFPGLLFAGIDPSEVTASRASALGNAYTAVNGDFGSLFHNPAGIAGIKNPEVGIFFYRRFNLAELTRSHAGLVFPFQGSQAAGLEAGSFGFEFWRENLLAFSYGITFFEKISLGAKVSYVSLLTPDAGNVSALYATVGTQTVISPQLSLGFSASNVNRAGLWMDGGKEDLPSVFSAGISYRPSNKVMLVADVRKHIAFPLSGSGGIEYAITPTFLARLGVSTYPLTFNSGLGLRWENLTMDMAFSYHERLGYTPHISLNYRFTPKNV